MELSARFFDGKSSQAQSVRLLLGKDARVHVLGDGINRALALTELDIAPRIGNTPRSLRLPDGAQIEISDNNLLDDYLRQHQPRPFQAWVHYLESHIGYVLLAVVLTSSFTWGMLTEGIPWLAEQAAYALPTEVDRKLGQGTLTLLDRGFLEPSQLPTEDRQRLSERFQDMAALLAAGEPYRLEFRGGGKIGANALALPSGIIVLTDELVALSENDDEVASVLAHEIGHLAHRHSIRMVMQDSALVLLVTAITGDAFSTSSLVAALPTVLAHAQYSQAFETEADAFAYEYLTQANIPTQVFADMMLRIAGDDADSAVAQYLSSHPGTQERIQRFRTP